MDTKIINSKANIKEWVDGELGKVDGKPSNLFRSRPDYQLILTRITEGLAQRASEDGYQYGEDWAEFFEGITIAELIPD